MADSKERLNIREKLLERRSKYYDFRDYYTDQQLTFILILTGVDIVYSLFAYFFIGKHLFLINEHAQNAYLSLGFVAIVSFIPCFIGKFFKIFKTQRKKAAFFSAFTMIGTLAFIAWGFQIIAYSILEGGSTQYLPLLIIYAACSLFLYFSIPSYIIFYLACCVGCYLVVHFLKSNNFDYATVFDIVVFGLFLTIGGILKYITAEKEFRANMAAKTFQENLESNNKELTRANDGLTQITRELERRNESQRLFTASMSHEIRSPLNGVIGLLQVMRDDYSMSDEMRESVEKAFSSSATLIQIVNDLLDYSKLEAGEFNIINGEFDLREIIDNINNVSKDAATQKGINLIYDIDDDMPCVFAGDGIRVQQIVQNIVSNGIKYTEKGYVRVEVRYSDGKLIVKVSDTGQGISEKAMETLFDPFKRLNEKKNKFIQGTGLGLSIVKRLVEQMHGDINVESKLGEGSTFTISISTCVINPDIKYGDRFVRKVEEVKTLDLRDRNFLCIDDNKVNLAVFKGLLKESGAKLTLISSGIEGLEAVTKEKYDIIFLDHMMPEMDGLEVFEHMKVISHPNKKTPVVMLTANAGLEAEKLYLSKGFAGYLSKPILKAELFKKINEVIK